MLRSKAEDASRFVNEQVHAIDIISLLPAKYLYCNKFHLKLISGLRFRITCDGWLCAFGEIAPKQGPRYKFADEY
jgi:hypothetical protein